LPSRKTASHNLLDQVYTRLVEAVKRELATATAIPVTTDGWTSMSNNNNNNSLFTPRKQLQETTHGALERTKSGNKMHHLHRSLLQSLLNLFVETPQKSNSLQ
jgi:hypothetical protein